MSMELNLKAEALIAPTRRHGFWFYLTLSILTSIVAWGVYAWVVQLNTGLGVTGMRTVIWGTYIINFVFFIGISHVGALISAILRLTGSEWRRPVTRMAEAVTFASLLVAMTMPFIDLGRPDRVLNLFLFGRIQSPLVWDLISIGTYFVTSTLYLYVPMIPDLALLRDSMRNKGSIQYKLYRILSLGWSGAPKQWEILERLMRLLTYLIVFMVITVHTVVSWDFAMTLRVGWNSTIFGPYFVAGAVLSGVATVLLIMVLARRVLGIGWAISDKHISTMAKLLLALDIIVIYFTINEFLVTGYKYLGTSELEGMWLAALFWGPYATTFWIQVVAGLILPAILLASSSTSDVKYVIAAILINVGMWLERWNIVVPTLSVPQLPYPWGTYTPTWVEWSIMAGAFALFMLIYTIFAKLFPIVSIWETVGHEVRAEELEKAPAAMRLIVPQRAVGERRLSERRTYLRMVVGSLAGFALGWLGSRYLSQFIRETSRVYRPSLAVLGSPLSLGDARRLGLKPEGLLAAGWNVKGLFYNVQARLITILFDHPQLEDIGFYTEPVKVMVLLQRLEYPQAPPENPLPGLEVSYREDGSTLVYTPKQSKLELWRSGYKVTVFAKAGREYLSKTAEQARSLIP
ncbi:Menaquinone reductase, integral membrane subunit [archaeon HR01]|nr:Menaquinone reductase, integral membrane subunit [archaeon HR01]